MNSGRPCHSATDLIIPTHNRTQSPVPTSSPTAVFPRVSVCVCVCETRAVLVAPHPREDLLNAHRMDVNTERSHKKVKNALKTLWINAFVFSPFTLRLLPPLNNSWISNVLFSRFRHTVYICLCWSFPFKLQSRICFVPQCASITSNEVQALIFLSWSRNDSVVVNMSCSVSVHFKLSRIPSNGSCSRVTVVYCR